VVILVFEADDNVIFDFDWEREWENYCLPYVYFDIIEKVCDDSMVKPNDN